MKKTALSIIMALLSVSTLMSHAAPTGRVVIGVKSDSQSALDATQTDYLVQSVRQVITQVGEIISSGGSVTPIMVIPTLFVLKRGDISAQGQKLYMVEVEIILGLSNIESQHIFSSHTLALRGQGSSDKEALMSSIRAMQGKSDEIKEFMVQSSAKVNRYYDQNSEITFHKAAGLAMTFQYDGAIAQLAVIPESSSRYLEAHDRAMEYYMDRIEHGCLQQLHLAHTQYVAQDYMLALETLAYGELSTTSIKEQAQELVEQIESRLTQAQEQEWEEIQRKVKNDESREKIRLQIIRNIANVYFSDMIQAIEQ